MPSLNIQATRLDRRAPRRTISLSISEDLMARAEGFTRNLSATMEELLKRFVADEQAKRLAADADLDAALEALNSFHREHGVLSDKFEIS